MQKVKITKYLINQECFDYYGTCIIDFKNINMYTTNGEYALNKNYCTLSSFFKPNMFVFPEKNIELKLLNQLKNKKQKKYYRVGCYNIFSKNRHKYVKLIYENLQEGQDQPNTIIAYKYFKHIIQPLKCEVWGTLNPLADLRLFINNEPIGLLCPYIFKR